MSRSALVTNALPYANGPLHLGHLVGYIQADIWVRARRLRGDTVHYVCADDTHGTPIMLAAEKAGVTPEAFIAGIQAGHERDFADFGVAFDHYDSTHSDANREITELLYSRLDAGGHIARRSVAQFYDPETTPAVRVQTQQAVRALEAQMGATHADRVKLHMKIAVPAAEESTPTGPAKTADVVDYRALVGS